jgi:putative CRISPR-associated protein (TIGR02620 family)
MNKIIIVSRHRPLVEWLNQHGITGDIIEHVTDPAVLDGADVFGILPLHLAARAASVTEVSMPNLTLEQRQKNAKGDMGVAEMDAAGARLRKFIVREVS